MAKKKYYDSSDMGGEMIGSGMNDYAGLPANPVVKLYPKPGYSSDESLNDGIKGIDVQIKDDMKNKKKKTFPEKY